VNTNEVFGTDSRVADASHVRLVETRDAYGGFTGGTDLDEETGTGNFNATSISGSSYVFGWGGTDANGVHQVAGLLSAGSGGGVCGMSHIAVGRWPILCRPCPPQKLLARSRLDSLRTGVPRVVLDASGFPTPSARLEPACANPLNDISPRRPSDAGLSDGWGRLRLAPQTEM
jgi:hypothetical protein